MRHYGDDELVLYHYGESRHRVRIDRHLQACAACAAAYRQIADTLATVGGLSVPERDDRYGIEVWQRIRHELPIPDAPWWMFWHRPALIGLGTLAIVAAFAAGRFWSPPQGPAPTAGMGGVPPGADARVRLAAIGDHLEQSERVLLDLVNAEGPNVDFSGRQESASDLVRANRLLRQAAERAGDERVAGVLDELERNLLEIVNGPSPLTGDELEGVRVRLDAGALVFKVRVLSNELRERELALSQPWKAT